MKTHLASALVAAAVAASASLAQPVNLTFTRINGNAPQDVASQFLAVVDDGPGDTVTFRFTNTAAIASSITNIYFDDNNSLMNFGSFVTQTGTSFAQGGSPGNVPGGNSINPAFNADIDLNVSAQGNPANGINTAADVLVVAFNLLNGANFANLASALNNGDLRVAFHVRAIGTADDSDSFVSTVIPLPTTAALAGVGLLGLATRRRR